MDKMTEIYWRWGCYPHCKWLAGGPRSRVLLQWNQGFGKMLHGPSALLLEETMFKSDKITCAYSVVNCYKLFEHPLLLC